MDMDRVTWVCAHVTLPGLVKAVSKSTAASLIALITEIVQMVCKIFSAALTLRGRAREELVSKTSQFK